MDKNKFDPKEPVQFRHAPEKVRVLAADLKSDRPIIIAAMTPEGTEWSGRRYPDGRLEHDRDSDYDLVNVPKKRTIWANICDNGEAFLYETEERASMCRGKHCIACVRVEFTEGEGL